MGACFSLEAKQELSLEIPSTVPVFEDIVDDKHQKYMNVYEGAPRSSWTKTFWGIGIENESYLMLKTMLGIDFFNKLQRKRERYSVDYYKNFKKDVLDSVFDRLSTCSNLTYPIYINSHTFQSTDVSNEHRTLYDVHSTPNPKFKESLHDLLLKESAYYKEVFGKSFVFDGDSIEFITQQFYCTTAEECVEELMSQKRKWIETVAPFFKKWKIGDLQFPDHNYGLVSFLSTYRRNVTPCNNGTLHINLTLPTEIVNGVIVKKEAFIQRHLKVLRFIQLVEPLLVACYGTPDFFSLLDSRYSMGSLRVSLSRYISLQTFDTEHPKNGKLLHLPRPLNPEYWYNRIGQSSPYVMCDEIGYDVNFNKFKNHGIELRFFDWFPEQYLTDVLQFLLLLISHADHMESTSFLKSNYNGIIAQCLQKGFTYVLSMEEIQLFCRDLQLPPPNATACWTAYSFLQYINQWLFHQYHQTDLIQRMSPKVFKGYLPRLVNYNEMAFKKMYADVFSKPKLILRAELHPDEHRTPLIPTHLSLLRDTFHVMVESSSSRCYPDSLYQHEGAVIVRPGYWKDTDHSFVIGLKAIDAVARETQTLLHFAHCFYGQKQAIPTLRDLSACTFIDYETLVDSSGMRTLSFCKPSGKIGCYLALMAYYCQIKGISSLPPFDEGVYRNTLIKAVMEEHFSPRILLIGYGTVGKSAKEVLDQLGLDCTIWHRSHQKSSKAILSYSILLHAIRLRKDHSEGVFLDPEELDEPRQLRVICDISCDLGHPLNPLPIYDSFTQPMRRLRKDPPLDLIAIDHLPSLEPIVSSNVFSSCLKNYLVELPYFKYISPISPLSAQLQKSYDVFKTICQSELRIDDSIVKEPVKIESIEKLE